VGVCAFSGTLCSLKLIPLKWRFLSHPPAGNASRWAADLRRDLVKRPKFRSRGILTSPSGTRQETVARLHFNRAQKYLGLFDENRNEERVPINEIDDIYSHAERIVATINLYGAY